MGYRQTQTALSTLWMSNSDSWFNFLFPVFGYPWLLPLEYPIFQIIAYWLSGIEFIELETSGRLLSLIVFYLSLIPIKYILRKNIKEDLIFYFFYLTSPILLYFSSKFLIDGFVFFLSVSVLASFLLLIKNFSIRNIFIFFLFCNLCGLQKITGLMAVLTGCGVYFIFHLILLKDRNHFKEALKFSFIFAISIIIPISWVLYGDQTKEGIYLTSFLVSDALSNWNYGTLDQRLDFYNLSKVLGWRIGLLGGVFLLAVRIIFYKFYKLKDNALAISCLSCGLFGPIVFFNLYLVHDYYLISSLGFIGLGLYLIVDDSKPRFNNLTISNNSFAISVLLINLIVFSYWYMPKTNNIPLSHEDMYKTALKVKNQLDPEKVILTSGVDWDSTIPFYTQNYSIMIPSWTKNEFAPIVDGEYFDPFYVLNNIDNYLGDRELGAIIICNIRMSEGFEEEVNFIKENWKLDWKKQGLCIFGLLDKTL
tara:strand:- start:3147 stop:4580 length:1434 start_codon:yes stop_codon:yes gene_type:complete